MLKTSIRYFAWAPLLIAGLALLYALAERLLGEPCPGEHVKYVIGHLVTAGFALYCLAGYWLAVTRAYLALSIATLWAFQLLVMSPALAPACGGISRLKLWTEPFGLTFLGFTAGIILFAVVTSVALHRRYRAAPAATPEARRTLLLYLLSLASVLSVLLVAAIHVTVPMFLILKIYGSFGADLPTPTMVLIAVHDYFGLLAVPGVAALLYAARAQHLEPRRLDAFLTAAVGLLLALNVCASWSLFALYAPTVKLCSCV